jgi:Baseplate J-like protein
MKYPCCIQRRLQAVADAGQLNGISYLEVDDTDAPTPQLRQRTLFVRLLLPPGGLTADNVIIDGGVRYPTVGVQWAAPGDNLPPGEDPTLLADLDDPHLTLVVRTDGTGDYSRYRLAIIDPNSGAPPTTFDPQLGQIEFSFKVECPNDFDCQQTCTCPPTITPAPPINYLGKDFDTLRQLMLDRITLLDPAQDNSRAADLCVALVEMLAYLGDHLSYRQDAIATEAYLGTARSRISLRRHARLVDYTISEGCNARVFAQLLAAPNTTPTVAAGTQLITAAPTLSAIVDQADPDLQAVLAAGTVEVFETTTAAVLDASLAELHFWTWGDLDCCLPIGATTATLLGAHPTLRAGDVLILIEQISPTTGHAADADPTHRAAVRLTSVVPSSDPSGGLFPADPDTTPPTPTPIAVTEITWDTKDALTFPLCLTANEGNYEVAIALGNIVLADHGRTLIPPQTLGPVPAPTLSYAPLRQDACATSTPAPAPVRFRPQLAAAPLTFAVPTTPTPLIDTPVTSLPAGVTTDLTNLQFSATVDSWLQGNGLQFTGPQVVVQGLPGDWSISDGSTVLRATIDNAGTKPTLVVTGRQPAATQTLLADPSTAAAAVTVTQQPATAADQSVPWALLPDLLPSGPTDAVLVVEIDTDATAVLRFGDNTHGLQPPDGALFTASYRVGSGAMGNVGAAAIAHIVSASAGTGLIGATNPMPAAGGVDPETPLAIRRDAPQAYQVQERAVTEADYAAVATRTRGVAAAVADFRWTGSWYTAFVTPEAAGGAAVDTALTTTLLADLDAYRMAGYDLDITPPVYVAIDIDLFVCVLPSYLPADIEAQLLARVGSGIAPDGTPGLFNPASWTFGRPVYLSAIYAVAQQVPGVQSVTAQSFKRRVGDLGTGLADEMLTMGPFEIAQCANDPNYPDHGVLTVTTGGGR